jgi:hypothetical protein
MRAEELIDNWYEIQRNLSLQLARDINSGLTTGMISNPRSEVGRKVESCSQQIIRAIFIFLTPPSTVNSQQSTMITSATGIVHI